MNIHEFRVLWATNMATARHQHPEKGYRATAEQIAEVAREDWAHAYVDGTITTRWVGHQLGQMAKGWPDRRVPLVERVDSRTWRLTVAGVKVLSA